ncbi:hypothetical protein MM239_17870 [Belliella sp. DSM 111904]|uniref:Uncharacterized protein n=1 Tax=Belliella filtrata TaxID=2923435 RepID=A0ABS9V4G2_9BACT|nr:hypothetical protein [Belliella filtrata]MCH7411268.1 hypothetical protein [Belliella filtrata]
MKPLTGQEIIGAMVEMDVDKNLFRAFIQVGEDKMYRGTILSVSDTGIVIAEAKFSKSKLISGDRLVPVSFFPSKNIQYLNIRKRNSMRTKNVLSASGVVLGIGIGFLVNSDSDPTNNALYGAAIGGLTGVILGRITTTRIYELQINGNESVYLEHLREFQKFSPDSLPSERLFIQNGIRFGYNTKSDFFRNSQSWCNMLFEKRASSKNTASRFVDQTRTIYAGHKDKSKGKALFYEGQHWKIVFPDVGNMNNHNNYLTGHKDGIFHPRYMVKLGEMDTTYFKPEY